MMTDWDTNTGQIPGGQQEVGGGGDGVASAGGQRLDMMEFINQRADNGGADFTRICNHQLINNSEYEYLKVICYLHTMDNRYIFFH